MSSPFLNAPHIEGGRHSAHPTHAPNAALLIDFDNVTMGIRSDLSKELKTLLGSEVIRGKVTVQRAYADWRRYPQYIVPLSEASIDLIFAPAYGSNKKNATDIRMAIDGMELVFTRPEIGTFILLTGDSDFSSLVLKLKEYGKYVIGVGIQESSSDILVQNCDEYYSYTSLSGLRRTDDGAREGGTSDPWQLVERAIEQMGRRGDVMRSDRLKQVLLELDPGFDEKAVGFSKFSKFVSEAARRGLLQTRRMENGQYEIVGGKGSAREDGESSSARHERGERGRRRRDSDRGGRPESRSGGRRLSDASEGTSEAAAAESSTSNGQATAEAVPSGDGEVRAAPSEGTVPAGTAAEVAAADALLRRAVTELLDDQESESVRDSDVKRRMLALDADFDEGTLGFPKFSRFLRHADERGVISLKQGEDGQLHVSLAAGREQASAASVAVGPVASAPAVAASTGAAAAAPSAREVRVSGAEPGRLRPREEAARPGKGRGEAPPIYEGQGVPRVGSGSSRPAQSAPTEAQPAALGANALTPAEVERLRLPKDPENVIRYLTNSYGGVGRKTAETLVEMLGTRVFEVLASDPDRVRQILPASRADLVLQGWEADLKRRRERYLMQGGDAGDSAGDADGSPAEGGSPVPEAPAYASAPTSPIAEVPDWAAESAPRAEVPAREPAGSDPVGEDLFGSAESAETRRRGRRTRDATDAD